MRKKRTIKPFRSERTRKKQAAALKKEGLVYLGIVVSVLLVLMLTTTNIQQTLRKPEVIIRLVQKKTDSLEHKSQFWQNILSTTPDYLPGLLELSRIHSELGNNQYAAELIQRAKSINPNDERVIETQDLISSKASR